MLLSYSFVMDDDKSGFGDEGMGDDIEEKDEDEDDDEKDATGDDSDSSEEEW